MTVLIVELALSSVASFGQDHLIDQKSYDNGFKTGRISYVFRSQTGVGSSLGGPSTGCWGFK
jgi:hypothetical protein